MGYSGWSEDFYKAREDRRERTGESAFRYHEEMRKRPETERKVHADMNPFGVNRESRDSKEHPESLAIMVPFDHTGSMGHIPVVLQKKLNKLMSLLVTKEYVKDPQIFFGAIGDAKWDRAPVQVGQFESGIEMDDDLGKLMLEGGGGPYGEESYELMLYFAARHTVSDCWEKRHKKAYLFLIGDEEPYRDVSAKEVRELFGDELGQDISVEKIVAEAKEKFNVFFVIPKGACGGSNTLVYRRWVKLLGQEYVLQLEDPETVCEAIAATIGLHEGKVDLEKAVYDLREYGIDPISAGRISRALAVIKEKAAVVAVQGNIPRSKRSKVVRL